MTAKVAMDCKRWGIWHVGTGFFLDARRDKGEARRWCRWWTRTNRALGLVTPGFRVQLLPAEWPR